MIAVLLAAGYGTRLYPLTRNRAKPLLEVGGRPILDHIVDRLDNAPEIERMVLVSNGRFAGDFARWQASRPAGAKRIDILNDGTTSNENRLGAVADIHLAVHRQALSGESVYVLATDNLPKFDLCDIISLSRRKSASAVFAVREDRERLKRSGVAELDEEGRIVGFEEKPEAPRGEYRVPPFYCYTPQAVALLDVFLDEGHNPDAPGHFLAWLVNREPVYARRTEVGTWDIGTLESYKAVCIAFGDAQPGGDVPVQGESDGHR
jgi:glucose-1-phosphate thymidylyltransferase